MGYDDRCIVSDRHRAADVGSGVSRNLPDHPVAGLRDDSDRATSTTRASSPDGRPFPPSNVRSWKGVSRGHWDGNTLVVETRNSNGRIQEAAVGPSGMEPLKERRRTRG